MSYLDAIRTCRYTSPSGAEFELSFDGLERSGGKKLSINEPPQQDRAEAIDLGNNGIRLPMTLYISGQDYTKQADAFYMALAERYSREKPATLHHPRWGNILVCPITWTQVESFVEEMGQAVFTIEFLRIDRIAKFPARITDAGGQLQSDINAAEAEMVLAYADAAPPDGPGDLANVTDQATETTQSFGEKLMGIATAAYDFGAKFKADVDATLASIDILVADPTSLALTLTSLAKTPAASALGISDKLRQFSTLVDTITTSVPASFAEAALSFLSIAAAALGMASATLVGTVDTRGDAIESADLLGDVEAALIAAIEAAEAGLPGWRPSPEALALILAMLAAARARMLETSFSLKTERRKVLTASVDPNTCVFDLYGTWSDGLLDQFGRDNDLADDEWFMIPAGREVVWYA